MIETLPHNLEAEKTVVGACMIEPEAVFTAHSILKPEYFYDEKYRAVYTAIHAIYSRNEAPDFVTVTGELQKARSLEKVGGAYELSKMGTVMPLNFEKHCRIIQECYLLRDIFRIAGQIPYQVSEPNADPFEIIENLSKALNSLSAGVESDNAQTLGEFIDRALKQAEMNLMGKRKSVPVRLNLLQALCGGYKAQRLIVMAARPGMGKTAVAFGDAIHAAKLGYPIGIFSQEMAGEELGERALSQGSGMDAMKISNGALNEYDLAHLREITEFNQLPIYIDDTAGLTLSKLRNRAIKMHRKYKIELLIVDYLQLCEGEDSKGNREQEISKVSRGLKKLAKELEIPVLALSQLNRQNESRAGNKPKLSDLRDSGAIEQDADMVILLHRPEYYGEQEYMLDGQTIRAQELMVQIIAKNRGGIIGEIPCTWKGSTMEIKDYMYL